MSFTPFQPEDIFSREEFNTLFQMIFDSTVNIQTGTYTGKGVFGESNPNSLTFNFTPKLVIISGNSTKETVGSLIFVRNSTLAEGFHVKGQYQRNVLSWGENTVSWYSQALGGYTSSADFQANASGIRYYYIAIG